ncbi:MAG: hypothetical protein ACOZF2_04785 [Thermodesulfobacteriota bacterium]
MRAELLRLPGVLAVTYHKEEDYFSVNFESVMVSLDAIFAAAFNAGRSMGREYLPELVT